MKQNQYDDHDFFDKYSQMPRSIGGLQAAGSGPHSVQCFPNYAIKEFLILAAAMDGIADMRASSQPGQ